jgi:hypothetical protein
MVKQDKNECLCGCPRPATQHHRGLSSLCYQRLKKAKSLDRYPRRTSGPKRDPQLVQEIMRRYCGGESGLSIVRSLNVGRGVVYKVIKKMLREPRY